ncbi:MAG: NrfD/PsrC family molybdoenzyme membrane anchor subunit [Ilumatobacteraceae bacterium]
MTAPVGTLKRSDRSEAPVGYYGKPIVRAHIWDDTIAWYFFTGGLAGASSVLAAAAELAGHPQLARHARRAAMVGLLPSPVLLISDLARPARFYNMLRVFKPTSPMSVGSWLLSAYAPAAGGSWILRELGLLPRLGRALGVAAGVIGPSISTYTAVLVADTATPVWHEGRRELPFVFASSSLASAGAAANLLSGLERAGSPIAGRLAAIGVGCELGSVELMHRRLGALDTYATDPATHRFSKAATVLSLGGAVGTLLSRRRLPTIVSSLAVLAGSVCERFAVVRAGTASASDPASVLTQQRPTG